MKPRGNVILFPGKARPRLSPEGQADHDLAALLLWLDGQGPDPFMGSSTWELVTLDRARQMGLVSGNSQRGHALTESGKTWLWLKDVR